MGYRTCLGSMPKKDYEEFRKVKTKKELADLLIKKKYVKKSDIWDYNDWEDEMYISVRNIPKKTIAEFWKYADFDEYGEPEDFFDSEEMNKKYQWDYELYIVSKEILRGVILEYTENVRRGFREKLEPLIDDKMGRFKEADWDNDVFRQQVAEIMIEYRSFWFEWGIWGYMGKDRVPYILPEKWAEHKDNQIVGSWWYMYSVFELTRLYNTFDEKKEVLIYYGS